MSEERLTERKAELKSAARRLQEAAVQPETDLVRDAVIQRFEFTFELVWKSLKLYLERQGLDCGGPRSTLKQAFTEGLITSPDEADVWFRMLEDRNLTSHAYDEALATRIYRHVVQDYTMRLGQMADKIQTLSWE
jgi:nucleotidyltransferase substrate binding protein (TIGR01987 family)